MLRTMFQAGRVFTVAFERQGDTVLFKSYSPRSATVYREPTFAGPMRKHGSDKAQTKGRDLKALDKLSETKSMVWPVLRRHNGKLSIAKVTP